MRRIVLLLLAALFASSPADAPRSDLATWAACVMLFFSSSDIEAMRMYIAWDLFLGVMPRSRRMR